MLSSETCRDALRSYEARSGDPLHGSAGGLKNFGWRSLESATVERRIGGVLDGELNLLRDSQSSIDSSRDAGGAHVPAVNYHASVDWNGSKVGEQMKRGPMRRGFDASEQARCAAKQGSGADRKYVRGGCGLCLNEFQHDVVIHQCFLPKPSRHDKQIELRSIRERRLWRND
jgi:hypothetical protein